MRVPAGLAYLLAAAALVAMLRDLLRRSFPVLAAVFIASLSMMLLQHVDPPRRTWLFILPFYFGAAAEGIGFALRRISRARMIPAVMALLLSLVMGVDVLLGGPLYRPGGEDHGYHNAESWGFPEAADVVAMFRGFFEHGGQLLADPPYNAVIEFELRRQAVAYHPSPSGELLLVTCRGCLPEGGPAGVVWKRSGDVYRYADIFVGRPATRERQ
jgi:hypothetical protein